MYCLCDHRFDLQVSSFSCCVQHCEKNLAFALKYEFVRLYPCIAHRFRAKTIPLNLPPQCLTVEQTIWIILEACNRLATCGSALIV